MKHIFWAGPQKPDDKYWKEFDTEDCIVCTPFMDIFQAHLEKERMLVNVIMLENAEFVWMPSGWQKDRTARFYLEAAKLLGKKIKYQRYYERRRPE